MLYLVRAKHASPVLVPAPRATDFFREIRVFCGKIFCFRFVLFMVKLHVSPLTSADGCAVSSPRFSYRVERCKCQCKMDISLVVLAAALGCGDPGLRRNDGSGNLIIMASKDWDKQGSRVIQPYSRPLLYWPFQLQVNHMLKIVTLPGFGT